MLQRSSSTGRRRVTCYGVSVSVHALILVGVGVLFAAHAGLGDPTVIAAIHWQRGSRTEPFWEPPEEATRELSQEPIEEEPAVRETSVDQVTPQDVTEFAPLVESNHALLHKTHWRKTQRKRKPARDLAVVEPTSRMEQLPADTCADAAGTAGTAGTVDAIPLDAPAPVYPPGSLRAREEGTVTLAIVIGSDGRTVSAEVHESSGFRRLDRAALEAVACWRFRPARIAGLPIQSTLLHRITFQLDGFSPHPARSARTPRAARTSW